MTETTAFPLPSVDLPPSIAWSLELLWRAVTSALTKCLVWYGAPETARTMPWLRGHPPLRHMLMLRRAQKILRCVIFIYARYFTLIARFAPSRARPATRKETPRRSDENDASTWNVSFLTPPRVRPVIGATNAPQPRQLVRAAINPMHVIARRMEGLRRVLAAPMPHVKRIARLITREKMIAPQDPKRRRPPKDRAMLWDELVEARHRQWWAFDAQNPRFNPEPVACDSS